MHPYIDKKASEGSPKVSRYILQVLTSKKQPHLGLSVIELVSQGQSSASHTAPRFPSQSLGWLGLVQGRLLALCLPASSWDDFRQLVTCISR